jgi:hypothetical protein
MTPSPILEKFEELARERSGGVVSLQLAWSAALKKLATAKMESANTESLAAACRAPRDVELVANLVGETSDADDLLGEAAQDSSYPLNDILTGLVALCRHLDRDRRQTSLKMAIGFVRCCEESMASYPALDTLAQVVESMLEDHGFDG